MRRRGHRAPVLGGLLAMPMVAAGCASEFDRAPVEACHSWGVVRGYSSADVEQVGRAAEEIAPRVAELLQPERREPLRIVVVPQSDDPGPDAWTAQEVRGSVFVPQFIVLGIDQPGPRRLLLAHELVHWYARGVWQRLPIAVEEGMADMIAARLEPKTGRVRKAFLGRLGEFTEEDVRDLLAVPRGEEQNLPPRRKDMLYLVGRSIAERIGVERLRSWCEEAERSGLQSVPGEWFLTGRHE